MLEDNTPTVTARKRKLFGQQRLRLDIAKKGATPKDRLKKKILKTGIVQTREPRIKKNVLQKPNQPKAKFRKRQIYKSWLPTHIFHAKRAHMTPPKEPLWRMAIPLAPTQKCYRSSHRASTLRGAIAWDMSYMSTVRVEGQEQSICGALKALGVGKEEGDQFWPKRSAKWMSGTRSWQGWLYERDGWPEKSIAPVTITWCPQPEVAAEYSKNEDKMDINDEKKKMKKPKRQVLIRVHPSAFLQLWEELLRLSKIQKPAIIVTDLRFEIGSIELIGPASTEVLTGTLQPCRVAEDKSTQHTPSETIWNVLRDITTPSSLPINAIIPLTISDPRLLHPAKTQPPSTTPAAQTQLLDVLSSWPLDKSTPPSTFFSRQARHTAQRQLPSQKAINRRKALANPGQPPEPRSTDPSIPILVLATRGANNTQGSWTILLPWKCVLPVWYSLLYYPLSSGGTIRFGGLEQTRQIAFENGIPWFPGDYMGTKAGDAWEAKEAERRKKEWEKRPKGKRVEFESVKLSDDRTGEIGDGWGCDWSALQSSSSTTSSNAETGAETGEERGAQIGAPAGAEVEKKMEEPKLHRIPTIIAKAALASKTTSTTLPSSPNGIITIKLTLLHRGIPTTCARIYRLPTRNAALLTQWLSLLSSSNLKKSHNKHTHPPSPPSNAPAHELRRHLAQSLLLDEKDTFVQAGEKEYPVCPEEEDLVGFVTTGNFNLGEGRATGLGCVVLNKVVEGDEEERRICVIREAGQSLGRLARWELV